MLKRILVSLVSAIVVGVLAYLLLMEMVIAVALMAVTFLATFFLIYPPFKEWLFLTRRRAECYRFVNSFIVSYAVSESPEGAFASAAMTLPEEGKVFFEELASKDVVSRLEEGESYFDAAYYRMFLSLFKIQVEEGGKFLDKAEPLLNEINQSYDDDQQKEKEKKRQVTQWASLWGLSALVLVFVRFALSNNYDLISVSMPYIVVGVCYFLLAIVAFVLFAHRCAEKPLFGKGATNGRDE